jgi:hypothetical protein
MRALIFGILALTAGCDSCQRDQASKTALGGHGVICSPCGEVCVRDGRYYTCTHSGTFWFDASCRVVPSLAERP